MPGQSIEEFWGVTLTPELDTFTWFPPEDREEEEEETPKKTQEEEGEEGGDEDDEDEVRTRVLVIVITHDNGIDWDREIKNLYMGFLVTSNPL